MILSGLASGQFRLEFVGDNQPPAHIPTVNEEMKFSVPAHRCWHHEVQVIVRVVRDDGSVITDPVAVTMTTILDANWPTHTVTDTYPGMVCDVKYRSPGRPYEAYFWVLQICDQATKTSETPFGNVTYMTENGEARFHRLLHTHATENGLRRLLFMATINGVTKKLASNPIEVTRQ
jgi:hypothetical protein